MWADQQFRASLKEIDDLKAALDNHAILVINAPQRKIASINDKFCATSKYFSDEFLEQHRRIIDSGHCPKFFTRSLRKT
jgi:hypothetical protein